MENPDKNLLVLVDGSSYLYRAFHALPPLANSRGEPTGAVYGVINMLRKLITDYQPQHIAIIFDAKGKTFRDEIYADYKAHRPAMPDDLIAQIEPLHNIIRAMGLPLVIIEGVEADDVIGTLALQASHRGMNTLISTGDKDIAQLVNNHITLINTMNNTQLDTQGVINKFGIPPNLIVDYLSLVGDSVDNIPGIPGVGPKTAVKWLQEWGSLDEIIKQADQIKGKVGDNLREHLTQLPLARTLSTIKIDVALPITINDLQPIAADKKALRDLFQHQEFKSWLAEILNDTTDNSVTIKQPYDTLLTQAQLDHWLTLLNAAELIAFDTETTSLDAISAQIVGVSFAIAPGKAAYIPLAHDYIGAPDQLSRTAVLAQLKPLLENPQHAKVGHNIKYDKSVLANYDIHLNGIRFDTMLESYIFDSTGSRHDLDSLALKYLGHRTIHFEDVAGKGAKQITFNQVAIEQATPYAAEDADISLQLHHKIWPHIAENSGLTQTFNTIEIPLLNILSQMERHGVLINAQLLQQQSKEFAETIAQLEQQAYVIAGQPFNLSSPKQLQEILYEKLHLPILEKTPTGQAATGESVLQDLARDYPLPKIILEHRSLSKLKSTYTDRLPEAINPKTGRVHTSYHQAVASTGRLSSSEPNLQNIPVKNAEGRRIRQAFIAPSGYKIMSADYSQIELRIMAHMSQDPGLLNAFAQGWDVHTATAAEVFGVALDQVADEQRRRAKAINFGLIYGMSAFGLSKQLDIDRNTAQQYIDIYFTRYPGVKQYMENTRQLAHSQGFVTTLYGRRLNLPEINSRNLQRQRAAERAAINAPLQGTAADVIKKAMIKIAAWLAEKSCDASMIMQVHDELVFEVADHAIDQAQHKIAELMCDVPELSVPFIVDIGIGNNWDEAH